VGWHCSVTKARGGQSWAGNFQENKPEADNRGLDT